MAQGINLPASDLWIRSVRVLFDVRILLFCLLVTGTNQSTPKGICYYSCYRNATDCSNMNISSISSIYGKNNHTNDTTTNTVVSRIGDKLLNNSIIPADQVTWQNTCLIKVLNLHNNLISTLKHTTWKHMVTVEYLDLSGNKLIELLPGVFDLPSLVSLNISWNLIGSINNQSFSNLPRLRSLDLSGNPLGHISLVWFDPITHLRYLNLSKCDIHIIPDGFGALFPNLETLDLSGNLIKYVTGAHIQQMWNISKLNIKRNPFHCDCKLLDFHIWIINNSNNDSDLICASPQNMNGQTIIEIQNLCNNSRFGISQVNIMIPVFPTRNTQLPYDPMMGIGTAIVLSGMLVLFLLCVLLDKLKRKLKRWWRERSDKESQYSYSIGYLDSSSKLHTFPDDVFLRTGSHYKGSQCICEVERNSISIQSSIDVYQKSLCVPRTSIDGKTVQYHSENIIDPSFTETHL